MTVDELLAGFRSDFARRKFAAGVLIAFVRFFRELGVYGAGYADFDAFLAAFPLSPVSPRGGDANTLTVEVAVKGQASPQLVSIRPAYNAAEDFFRIESSRFDYPNCAPHATGQWRDYQRKGWLDALVTFTEDQAEAVESAVIAHVLEQLPTHAIDPSQLAPLERRFTRLLEEFDLSSHKGEPQGAAFQGVIYAYIRADAPHLHLEVSRAGAGSSRLGRFGDIDGWDGERLVLSVEVKHFALSAESVNQVEVFLAEVTRLNALAIVAASAFAEEARERIAELGGRALDLPALLALVDLWDPLKQRAALQAFVYYIHRKEAKMPLMKRLDEFLKTLDEEPPEKVAAVPPADLDQPAAEAQV